MPTNVYRDESLIQYLRKDNWTAFDAAHILSDVDPETIGWSGMGPFEVESESDLNSARLISDLVPFTIVDCHNNVCVLRNENPNHKKSFQRKQNSILDKLKIMFSEWPSGLKGINKKPEEWVQWALKKQYSINWLQFAINKSFVLMPLQNIIKPKKSKNKKKKIAKATVDITIVSAEAQSIPIKEAITTEVVSNITKTNDLKKFNAVDVSALFDPLPSNGIIMAFSLVLGPDKKNRFSKAFERAARNGLKETRVNQTKPFKYNLNAIGNWLVNTGVLDQAAVDRVLASNLPRRSQDSKHIFTGVI